MKFSTELVRLRKAAGLSQSQAAARLGVPVRTLQKWEQGEREPTEFVMGNVCQLVGMVSRVPARASGGRHRAQHGGGATGRGN